MPLDQIVHQTGFLHLDLMKRFLTWPLFFDQYKFPLEGGNTQGNIEKGIRLIFGDQFVDPPINLSSLFDVVFPPPSSQSRSTSGFR